MGGCVGVCALWAKTPYLIVEYGQKTIEQEITIAVHLNTTFEHLALFEFKRCWENEIFALEFRGHN